MSSGVYFFMGLTVIAGIVTAFAVWVNLPLLRKQAKKEK